MVLIILLLLLIFWGPCFCVSFSYPESAASLLVEYYSNGLAQIPLLPTQGVEEEGGILQPAVAYSQYHYKLLSSTAILLSSLLPCGTAWHAAGVVHGTAVPLQVEREQKSFPVSPDRIRERTAGNVGAARCSSAAANLQAALWTQSPLRTCPMKASSFIQWSWGGASPI